MINFLENTEPALAALTSSFVLQFLAKSGSISVFTIATGPMGKALYVDGQLACPEPGLSAILQEAERVEAFITFNTTKCTDTAWPDRLEDLLVNPKLGV